MRWVQSKYCVVHAMLLKLWKRMVWYSAAMKAALMWGMLLVRIYIPRGGLAELPLFPALAAKYLWHLYQFTSCSLQVLVLR